MREFKNAGEVYRELYKTKTELRRRKGMRKRDLTTYHNRLVKLYKSMRKEERMHEKADGKMQDG